MTIKYLCLNKCILVSIGADVILPLLALRMCLSKFRRTYQDVCSSAVCEVRLCEQAVTRIQQTCWTLSSGFLETFLKREDKKGG